MICASVDPKDLKIDVRELSARLGMPYEDGSIEGTEAYRSLALAVRPSYCAVRVGVEKKDGTVRVGSIKSESRALLKLLESSDEAILLVATLGIGADRLILKRSSISAYEAFLIDAIADAMIEAVCDAAEAEVCRDIVTSPRFSPGYADLPLSFGEGILALTDAERRLGIKLTAGGMMIPKKSVSAIIAIKKACE